MQVVNHGTAVTLLLAKQALLLAKEAQAAKDIQQTSKGSQEKTLLQLKQLTLHLAHHVPFTLTSCFLPEPARPTMWSDGQPRRA